MLYLYLLFIFNTYLFVQIFLKLLMNTVPHKDQYFPSKITYEL